MSLFSSYLDYLRCINVRYDQSSSIGSGGNKDRKQRFEIYSVHRVISALVEFHITRSAKEGMAPVQTKRVGYLNLPTISSRSYLARTCFALTDLSRTIYPHDRFPPRNRGFGLVYVHVLRVSATRGNSTSDDHIGSTTSKHYNGGGEYPHQSYKADRLSWQTALPLYQATTTCHGPRFFGKEFKRRTLFRRTPRAVSSS